MTRKCIDPNELKPGPVRHDELPLSLVGRINYLRSTLDEVYPLSMAEWLDGFRRDANPESEVLWWEQLTRCYRGYSDTRDLNAEQKQAVFSVVFKLGMGVDFHALVSDLAKLPEGAFEEIAAMGEHATGGSVAQSEG